MNSSDDLRSGEKLPVTKSKNGCKAREWWVESSRQLRMLVVPEFPAYALMSSWFIDVYWGFDVSTPIASQNQSAGLEPRATQQEVCFT